MPKGQNSWLPGFEAGLLNWTGDKRQPCDQIDAAPYADITAEQNRGGVIRLQGAVVRS